MSADIPETFSFTRELGLRLKQLRIRAGLTRADVAELEGIRDEAFSVGGQRLLRADRYSSSFKRYPALSSRP